MKNIHLFHRLPREGRFSWSRAWVFSSTSVVILLLTLAGSVRADWVSGDVGAPAVPGEAAIDEASGLFEVFGAGTDIWGASDQFHFAWRELAADGEIVAKVESLENRHAWTSIL